MSNEHNPTTDDYRLEKIRGLNDVSKKRRYVPLGVMSALHGLQFGIPTWIFNSLFSGYYMERAKTAPHRLNPETVWQTTRTHLKGSAGPILGTLTAYFVLRDHFAKKYGWSSLQSFFAPMTVCALPSVGYSLVKRAPPPEAAVAGLTYAAGFHLYTLCTAHMDVGWKGGPTFAQR
eukprot:gb/GECG01016830.1/.p1 GENE.gb/GECG01016830.1/~~gb/GECG01016830.1/.p1  ORF type:complete len:175 (+),score=7.41 gb/GECG01016830.1/:1-525(+)